MGLFYSSTRGDKEQLTASQAILKGLADDGGLFVPSEMPTLDKSFEQLKEMSYQEIAYEVMKLFFTDYTKDELLDCINKAYDEKFDTPEIAPIVKVGDAYHLELFHGPTIAFKDMALSILPHLMVTAAKKNHMNKNIVILTATSGDTGKAALEGFSDVEGTSIIVFYPQNGVSAIQERQMLTTVGKNTAVVGVTGNFDDAQTGVKNIFNNKELAKKLEEKDFVFSSANSINIGRLIPQVAYYVYTYAKLLKDGVIQADEAINFVVPTGNFGNILAGFYAKKLGTPIQKLICASNDNKVLFDFFQTNIYNKNREFMLTSSPSMDILISSNLERLLYYMAGDDADKTAKLMADLAQKGTYTITEDMRDRIADFVGFFATEGETAKRIGAIYDDTGYVMDTHTAVASVAYQKYNDMTNDTTTSVVVSTASPYKFLSSVIEAIKNQKTTKSDFELVDDLHAILQVEIPKAIEDIRTAPILHDYKCEKEKMKQMVVSLLTQITQ